VLLHTADQSVDPVTAGQQPPDRGKRRRADAATALRRCHHQRDRRGVVHVNLGVDECHGLAIERHDPAGALAHAAASMFARWIGD
jgi:hypothetical protein